MDPSEAIKIFLSYARDDDAPFVWRLYRGLTAAGFDVWFDRVSMPARMLTFHQEIRDAIAACDRLVLVVGPNVVSSDYVTQEWRFAYFEALKCVNPIVRMDAVDAADRKADAYSLIPEDLRLVHAEDFRDDAQFDANLANLIRQLNDPLPPAGKLVAIPELPPHYLDQPARIAALRDILLADLQKPVVVSGAAARVGLQGMGGIGKSVLASALAHRPEVRRAFPDGVYWVTLGQEPNVADLQRGLARALGDDGLFTGADAGKEKLRELLAGRAALLVLDDVWQRGHAEAFNVLGPRGRLLLTTRDAGLVTALAAKENHYQVQLPTEPEAEALLAKAAGVRIPELPAEAREIVNECGRLPLGLALCGGMVQAGRMWQDALAALRERDLEYLSDSHPAEEQHRSIWKAMDASIRALPEDERTRFAELAVFALDTGAPETAVETLWGHTAGLTSRRARDLLMSFWQRSLVDFDLGTRRMGLHDLLHNFSTGMAAKWFGSLAALHGRLLDAYRKACANGWASGPNDGYFLQSLVGHLIAAGEIDDAVALLTDLPWIEAKCKAELAFGLHWDYRQTIEVLPEAQAELAEEQRRQERMAKYTGDLIAYARGEIRHLEVPASAEPWSDERIEAETLRIRHNPTAFDRLFAFALFVGSESYPLEEFGDLPRFVVQHALNYSSNGPVAKAAAILAPLAPLLVRRWRANDQYNSKPALAKNLEGHTDGIRCVSVTPDGRRAVSGGDDKTLRVWDLGSGECLRVLKGHAGTVGSVSVTPDGRRAISGSGDRRVCEWDLETGACLRTLDGHTFPVQCVSVTPDGRRAVSGSADETLRVWDLETGACLRVLEGRTHSINRVSVTPDGRRAVSGNGDSTVREWDLETGVCLRTFEGHRFSVDSMDVTPDGRWMVAGGGDHTLRVWDLENGVCLRVLSGHTGWVYTVSLTPDGRRALSGSYDHTLRWWDLESGECLRVLEGHTGSINSVSITPDGRWAVSSGDDDHTLRLWDLESGHTPALEAHKGSINSVSTPPDGRFAVSGSWDKTLRVWDLESGECLRLLAGHAGAVRGVSVTRDGRMAVSASWDHELRAWDLRTGACLRTLSGHTDGVDSVSVSPDGRRAVSASRDKTLRVWDLEGGDCVRVLAGHTYSVRTVCVMPDGQRAVSGGDRTIRVWDLESGECLRVLAGHTYSVDHVSVTPNGRWAVSATRDTLRVWDLESGACLWLLEGHTGWVTCMNVTQDGHRVVSGSLDQTLRVWDLESGKCLRVLRGHSKPISCVSVAANGWWAASGSGDKTLRIWNLEDGVCEAIVRLPAPIGAVALPTSHQLVLGTSAGEVAIYDVRSIDFGPVRES